MNTNEILEYTAAAKAADLLDTARRIAPTLAARVESEERNRQLSQETIHTLRTAGLYRMFVPRSLGGLETDPLTAARAVEEIARYNPAAAWSIMVTSTSAWWTSRLNDEGIEELYGDDADTFTAGTFHPPMLATPVDGGFLINGRSPLTSNVREAKWICVAAIVMENGKPKQVDGIPQVIGVCMKASECSVEDTWYSIGMKATDSNDTIANNVFVPHHRAFPLDPAREHNSHCSGPLYRFPAILAGPGCFIVPVAIALAANATEELLAIIDSKTPLGSMSTIKHRGTVQRKWGMAEAMLRSARAYLHHTITDAWDKTKRGITLSAGERATMQLAVAHVNQTCFQAVDLVYSAAGSTAVYTRSKISRYFLDAQVVRQHGFANESRYETGAQPTFGLPPDLPVVVF